MFTLFKSQISSFGGGLLQAKVQNPLPWQISQYWSVQNPFAPMPGKIPTFLFQVYDKAKHPDNYFTGADLELYSSRLIQLLLEDNPVQHELFDTEIYAKKSGEKLNVEYKVFRLTETFPIINLEKSVLRKDGFSLAKAVLHELPNSAPKLFRDAKFRQYVFIHHNLKEKLEREAVTGCQFSTLEAHLELMRPTFKE